MNNSHGLIDGDTPIGIRVELMLDNEEIEEIRLVIKTWYSGSVVSSQDMEALSALARVIGMDEEEVSVFIEKLIYIVDRPDKRIERL